MRGVCLPVQEVLQKASWKLLGRPIHSCCSVETIITSSFISFFICVTFFKFLFSPPTLEAGIIPNPHKSMVVNNNQPSCWFYSILWLQACLEQIYCFTGELGSWLCLKRLMRTDEMNRVWNTCFLRPQLVSWPLSTLSFIVPEGNYMTWTVWSCLRLTWTSVSAGVELMEEAETIVAPSCGWALKNSPSWGQ